MWELRLTFFLVAVIAWCRYAVYMSLNNLPGVLIYQTRSSLFLKDGVAARWLSGSCSSANIFASSGPYNLPCFRWFA
ncbi:hypothetical protein K443DRAFT_686512 [Laccaria amethystina LaAM-08-1]|uniref:Unplaced genomic scaffold K443scaffold_578, whole genome shotgun sequence n=1 Tax=Laccaria amethystina LaAM-08-1 TaxID=1095629 RepID=A0A0C9WS21_9AGAR|nr:hypothetical protein K443DRAFT_686512 [Laccaria amethystina LaAM-08-1]